MVDGWSLNSDWPPEDSPVDPGDRIGELGQRINQRFWARAEPKDGIDVMAEDWDTLVLLDACRHDAYEAVTALNVERVRAPGSTTLEFLDRSLLGRTFHDTVYVTANPHVEFLEPDIFHATIGVLDETEEDRPVPGPEPVRRAAERAHEEFPHKRILVHFMQPHRPFLTPFGRTVEMTLYRSSVMYRPGRGTSRNDVRRAYRENLNLVLEAVNKLDGAVDGKVVVSADHGELLGERERPIPVTGYGHAADLPLEPLTGVPWHPLSYDTRREVTAGRPVRYDVADVVEERLADFGYVQPGRGLHTG